MEGKKDSIEIKFPRLPKLNNRFRENPWILSTIVLAVLVFMFLVSSFNGISGHVISPLEAEDIVMNFLNENTMGEIQIVNIEDTETGFYEVTLSLDGQLMILYVTRDGKNIVQGIIPVEDLDPVDSGDAEPILECVQDYGISEDTIIFYYSNSCGWCTKMKPGVQLLESQGYNFKWIEAGGEDKEIIEKCIRAHMTTGGVPQFVCPKNGEIHVGAFADSNGNLDEASLKEWVDECIN